MIYLSDIFSDIVGAMTLTAYYKFGYWPEISNELMSKGKSFSLSQQRYPMIMLSAGWTETKELKDYRISAQVNPSVYIVAVSKKEYSTEQRKENVYKEILDPLYEELIQAIKDSKRFLLQDGALKHEKTDLYYLRTLGADQNQLHDFVDAIEIKFNDLKILRRKCDE